jgi:hypothetical protein
MARKPYSKRNSPHDPAPDHELLPGAYSRGMEYQDYEMKLHFLGYILLQSTTQIILLTELVNGVLGDQMMEKGLWGIWRSRTI